MANLEIYDKFAKSLGMVRFSERRPEINQSIVFQVPLTMRNIKSQCSIDTVRGVFTDWYDYTAVDGSIRIEGSAIPIALLSEDQKALLAAIPAAPCVLVNPKLCELYASEIDGVIPLRELYDSAWWCSDEAMIPGTHQLVATAFALSKPKVPSKLVWNGHVFN